ncbi:MAG: site-specific DNA-methyltransferase, partial [Armatimonadetes bacterium]|nr:site-specific DNA-methyltransferase [Armatimonadota bacterium]
MRKKKSQDIEASVLDYRYDSKRKNIPPAALAAQGQVREAPKLQFEYNPHLPPVLRFDTAGKADRLPELLKESLSRPLTREEAKQLADALRNHEPWLEWSGKREKKSFEVDPVALHIHERVSAQAILKVAAREDVQRSLFADPQLDYHKAVQFYQHDIDWANRMILGDSLQVMASLARREDLAGKVQMIYMDPPYGIKFSSNFQPEIGKRDVKDRDADLTREPEMVKAYRDTWTLGVHSYLAYLRDRLYLCKELLADSGSIFVQIGDENLHRVRALMDEVFGSENICGLIPFNKTGGFAGRLLAQIADYLLWYAKDTTAAKYRQLYLPKRSARDEGQYDWVELPNGIVRDMTDDEIANNGTLPAGSRILAHQGMASQGAGSHPAKPIELNGRFYQCPASSHWKTTPEGVRTLTYAGRLFALGDSIRYKRFLEDFPGLPISNIWMDVSTSGFARKKQYVVETNYKVIERCLLMTTDPGDLVLDPTCGSGTTAYVAEQWGRRWITIDTSRVAVSLARQRLMTATYPLYKVQNGELETENSVQSANPAKGFIYKKVPHITLKSIAQNVGLDPIFAKHAPVLEGKLAVLNDALNSITPDVRARLAAKLAGKEKREGRKAITDADRRRWLLPKTEWKEWEVPFDADEAWTPELRAALEDYRAAWRAKMDEVNACIAANAEMEELVDQPEVVPKTLRVSGPFTVEAVMPAEESLGSESPIGGEPEE